jgi:hypothetical protein
MKYPIAGAAFVKEKSKPTDVQLLIRSISTVGSDIASL